METTNRQLAHICAGMTVMEARLSAVETALCFVPPDWTEASTSSTSCNAAATSSDIAGNSNMRDEASSMVTSTPKSPVQTRPPPGSASTGISPLLATLPEEMRTSIKKCVRGSETMPKLARKVCGQIFQKEELAEANVYGKKGKKALDTVRTDLIKRKCNLTVTTRTEPMVNHQGFSCIRGDTL